MIAITTNKLYERETLRFTFHACHTPWFSNQLATAGQVCKLIL